MNIDHWFIDTVSVKTVTGFVDGDVTVGAAASVTGRWEEHWDTITLSGGEERTTSHKFATRTAIELGSFIFGPGTDTANDDEGLRVLRRKYARTPDGNYDYYIHWAGK